ncbi:MAG: hypothetical protein ACRDY7_09700 [Acidimicrobiia bacterium]
MAAIAVARSLARVPCELTAAEKTALVEAYGEQRAEWIALSVVMMGFLNKFMDAIGVELEQQVVAEVSATMGAEWSPGKAGLELDPVVPQVPVPPADGLRTKLRLVPLLPGAIRFDRQVQRDTPRRWPTIGAYLAERTGHDFPVLGRIRSARARRAIASMLRENLDPATSVVGLGIKVMTGAVFAATIGDEHVAADVRALAMRAGVDGDHLDAVAAFAHNDSTPPPGDGPLAASALLLARAAAPSPARIDRSTVAACQDGGLSAPAIVEIIAWLSVLQMLHRLTCYTQPPA